MAQRKIIGTLAPSRRAILCFGLQSGGSTLVSYCFLQRHDLYGVLDWFHDRLPEPPKPADQEERAWWCKSTVASFRASETIAHVRHAGFETNSFLIVRDVRRVFDSLLGKPYGRNSTTAEDPPLRVRMTRFLDDWRQFRAEGRPILKFEDFAANPEPELRAVCNSLGLTWSEAMVSWPKPKSAVWDGAAGSRTFLASVGANLRESLAPSLVSAPLHRIGRDDVDWLEQQFEEYNAFHGYTQRLGDAEIGVLSSGCAAPSIRQAKRYPSMRARQVLRRLVPSFTVLSRSLKGGGSAVAREWGRR